MTGNNDQDPGWAREQLDRMEVEEERLRKGRRAAKWHDKAFPAVDKNVEAGLSINAATEAVWQDHTIQKQHNVSLQSFRRMYSSSKKQQLADEAGEAILDGDEPRGAEAIASLLQRQARSGNQKRNHNRQE